MPNYSYKCTCGREFEAYAHVDHRDRVKCQNCGQKAKRTMSRPLIVIPEAFGQSVADIEALTAPSDLATGSYTTERHRFAR
jgi:putative FmdB family regulatory protein